MAMKLLRFREVDDEIIVSIHLDTEKLIGDDPDPLYVVMHTFPSSGEGLPRQQYLAWVRQESRERARRQLQELNRALARRRPDAGTALAGEGATFQ